MTAIRHVFTSPQADVGDPTLVRPSNWNESHAFTLLEAASLLGNTAGALALVSSGTLFLAGGNNITLSQNGNSVTISGAVGGGAGFTAGLSNLGNTLGDTGVVTGRLVLAGGNNVTLSQATAAGGLATITISAFNQSLQPSGTQTLGMSNLGNTSGTSGVATGSGVQFVFAGGNNVTLSQSLNGASGTITISAFNQSVQTQNLRNVTLAGNTAGALADISSGTLTLAGGNNVTLSQAGNAVTISAANQSVQTQNRFNLTLAGNTAGALAEVSSGTLTLAGGNNITLSQAGNAITISGATIPAQTVESNTFGISNMGNTAGTSGVVFAGQVRYLFAGGNNVTLSQSLDGVSGTVTISAFNQSVQPEGTQTFGMSNLGNTSGTTGVATGTGVQFVFAGGNNVTLSQSLNGASATITISAFNQSVQPALLSFSAGTTRITSGEVIFSAANGLTFGVNGQTVTGSYSQSTHAHSYLSAGMSTLGNTLGTTGLVAERLIFVGGDNITLSQSVNGVSATLTISAAAPGGGANLTVSDNATSLTVSRLAFTQSNNVTLSLSTGAGVATVIASFNPINIGVSTMGNTSGNTGTIEGAGAQFLFAGGNNITLSQSINGASVTLTISGENPEVVSHWSNFGEITAAGTVQGNSLVSLVPIQLPMRVAVSNWLIPVSISIATAGNSSSAYMDMSVSGVLYTRNVSTLSSLYSFSNSMAQTWSSNNTGTVTGVIGLTATMGLQTLTPGQYWLALHLSTTNTNTGAGTAFTALAHSVSVILAGAIGSAANLLKGWGAQTANSLGVYSGMGILSTGVTRGTLAFSDYTMTGTRGFLANVALALRNQTYAL